MAQNQEEPTYISESEEENKVEDKAKQPDKQKIGGQVVYLSTFKDFLLKEELLRAIKEAGFEKPSLVQNECILLAVNGKDILCQAKAGTGKTAVFVLSILNQMTKDTPLLSCLILCHVRELAHQIKKEIQRLGKFLPYRVHAFLGGIPISEDIKVLKSDKKPHIVVGTPGRILELMRQNLLKFDKLKWFVIDECDKVLSEIKMRGDVQEIFTRTPHEKQVMMFSGTLPEEHKAICRKFMQDQIEVIVEDNSKLVLHGLDQYFVSLMEKKKMEMLNTLLQHWPFNQVIIFVNKVDRAKMLSKLLNDHGFQNICIHGDMEQPQRLEHYDLFKQNNKRIMVATDVFGRGIDIERVNVVINFDMPRDQETYMHRVGRAGRFETKGMAISFVATNEDKEILDQIQKNFVYEIKELPKEMDLATINN